MVQFHDPIQNKELSYHIDPIIKTKWDKLKDGRLIKQDQDRVYLVDGRERLGKSVFTFQQAKYLDPSFKISRICFTPDDFLNKIRNAEKGQVVVFDEAFRGLSSKATQSKVNKKIIQAMMEMGQRNLIVFIVLPTFFLLEMYAAVLRSNALFHIYEDKNGKRCWRIYNYNQKSILYQVGKKKGFSYRYPKAMYRGRFYNIYAVNEQEYRKKKEESFKESDYIKEEEEDKISFERKLYLANLLEILIKYYKSISNKRYTQTDFCKDMKRLGANYDQSYVSKVVGEIRKKKLIMNYE